MIGDLKVLYIEDNEDNRKLVNRILRAAGITVDLAPDGRTGLSYVESELPDLILVDINLPEIDGYTVVRELRKTYDQKQLPILALTAHALKDDQEKCIAAGCNGYIAKPIDVDTLPEQILSYLE
ncbi:MAG: response regulator [Anaerolineales bacterium]|nr:response regulator [Anaerolineales bacterium]MCB9432577.1 response regulator [Ardenticatenaceae bacterium]